MGKNHIEMTKDYNVEFRTALNRHSVSFQINSFRGLMYATVSVDGEVIVAGEKVVRGVSLLPARYKPILGGVLYFGGNGVGYPDAESMDNVTSTLIYETDD
jgi:hypothetical protein